MNGCLHSRYTEGLAKVGSEVQEVKGNRKGHAVAAWQRELIPSTGELGI